MDRHEMDWRTHLVTTLGEDWRSPWTNDFYKKGSRLYLTSIIPLSGGKTLSIPVPNATALCLNSSRRSWASAMEIRKGSKIDPSIKKTVIFPSETDAFDFIESSFEAVLMAYAALEAFSNELIPDSYEHHSFRNSKIIMEVMKKADIERWLSLDEKLSVVMPAALGVASPKQSRCWSGFKKLKKIRDRITHMKADDRRSSGPEKETLWNSVFHIESPHRQAKDVIDFFVSETNSRPQWHGHYPSKSV